MYTYICTKHSTGMRIAKHCSILKHGGHWLAIESLAYDQIMSELHIHT